MSSRMTVAGLGVAVAVAANAIADVAAYIALRRAGGPLGCGSTLDAGARFDVFTAMLVTYGIAQLLLGGTAAGLSALAKPRDPYWSALGGAWAVLALLSILAVCNPGCGS